MDDLESQVKRFREATKLEEKLSLSDSIMEEIAPDIKAFVLNTVKSLGRIELADDLLQEALIRIFRQMHTFQGQTARAFWAWCYQVTRHLLIDSLRSPKFRDAEPLDFEDLEQALNRAERARPLAPGEPADLEYALNLLRASKAECADILWKHYVLGWSHSEVGNALGVSEDVARMRIKRCLERAQTLIEGGRA